MAKRLDPALLAQLNSPDVPDEGPVAMPVKTRPVSPDVLSQLNAAPPLPVKAELKEPTPAEMKAVVDAAPNTKVPRARTVAPHAPAVAPTPAPAEAKPDHEPISMFASLIRGLGQGATLDHMPELYGALDYSADDNDNAWDVGKERAPGDHSYSKERNDWEKVYRDSRHDNPYSYAVGYVPGMLVSAPGRAAKAGVAGLKALGAAGEVGLKEVLKMGGKAALGSGLFGAIQGEGNSEADVASGNPEEIKKAAKDAALSAAISAAFGGVAGAGSAVAPIATPLLMGTGLQVASFSDKLAPADEDKAMMRTGGLAAYLGAAGASVNNKYAAKKNAWADQAANEADSAQLRIQDKHEPALAAADINVRKAEGRVANHKGQRAEAVEAAEGKVAQTEAGIAQSRTKAQSVRAEKLKALQATLDEYKKSFAEEAEATGRSAEDADRTVSGIRANRVAKIEAAIAKEQAETLAAANKEFAALRDGPDISSLSEKGKNAAYAEKVRSRGKEYEATEKANSKRAKAKAALDAEKKALEEAGASIDGQGDGKYAAEMQARQHRLDTQDTYNKRNNIEPTAEHLAERKFMDEVYGRNTERNRGKNPEELAKAYVAKLREDHQAALKAHADKELAFANEPVEPAAVAPADIASKVPAHEAYQMAVDMGLDPGVDDAAIFNVVKRFASGEPMPLTAKARKQWVNKAMLAAEDVGGVIEDHGAFDPHAPLTKARAVKGKTRTGPAKAADGTRAERAPKAGDEVHEIPRTQTHEQMRDDDIPHTDNFDPTPWDSVLENKAVAAREAQRKASEAKLRASVPESDPKYKEKSELAKMIEALDFNKPGTDEGIDRAVSSHGQAKARAEKLRAMSENPESDSTLTKLLLDLEGANSKKGFAEKPLDPANIRDTGKRLLDSEKANGGIFGDKPDTFKGFLFDKTVGQLRTPKSVLKSPEAALVHWEATQKKFRTEPTLSKHLPALEAAISQGNVPAFLKSLEDEDPKAAQALKSGGQVRGR